MEQIQSVHLWLILSLLSQPLSKHELCLCTLPLFGFRRYPQYIDDRMMRTMNEDIRAGEDFTNQTTLIIVPSIVLTPLPKLFPGRQISPQAWRDFQLRDPVVRAEAARSGAQGSRSHFGGGSSRGGGGRGGSW